MIDRAHIRRWEQYDVMVVGLAAASLLALSVSVQGGPRPEAGVIPQGAERMQLIGVSRIDELPPLPPGVRPGTEGQLTGIPVPVYRMISDEELALGRRAANTGAATAVVYRSGPDSGYGNFNKATEGNFVGNLLHLGNGFPVTGGEIKGYDTLVYNSVFSPGGNASCIVSLWDGDPLGFIDTRISDPPQQIPGTTCTFTDMVRGGSDGSYCDTGTCVGGFADGWSCDDDTDCGLCPAIGHDDIAECPGLYRLECNFAEKVMLPSRNVWMIIEWTEGCRMGWRWALFSHPEVAAVGEENFCAGSCSSSPMPCVDLAIEYVDAASQWDGEGVGTCCEDPGITCDHSDGVYECGHHASCSDGEAESEA